MWILHNWGSEKFKDICQTFFYTSFCLWTTQISDRLRVQIHFYKTGIYIFDWGMGFFNDFSVKLKFLKRRPRFAKRLVLPKLFSFISYLTPKRIFHWYMIIFSIHNMSIPNPVTFQVVPSYPHNRTHTHPHIYTSTDIYTHTHLMRSSRSTSIFSFLQVALSRFSSLFQFVFQSFLMRHILSPYINSVPHSFIPGIFIKYQKALS